MRFSLLILLLLPAPDLMAQELGPDDTGLSIGELQDRLSGQMVEFYDGSRARFGTDGTYSYQYRPEDDLLPGNWEAREGSLVCVTFTNGLDRCDAYVVSRDRLMLITLDGDRFPVRREGVLE